MSRLDPPVGDHDHVRGRGTLVTVVEYGDYECPRCGQAQASVRRLGEELGAELRFIFRHFPLSRIHPHAAEAAEAAETAALLGDFWSMHELLFAHQDRLDSQSLRGYAHQLRLDLETFDERMRRHAALSRVREQLAGGERSGVSRTPTFFINDERHDGTPDADSLLARIWRVV